MKMTEARLRSVIRSVVKEWMDDSYDGASGNVQNVCPKCHSDYTSLEGDELQCDNCDARFASTNGVWRETKPKYPPRPTR